MGWPALKLVMCIGLCACFSPSLLQADLTTNLQGYWQFNSNATDTSGNGLDLNIVGGAGYSAGLIGDALRLVDNPGQYAQRPSNDTVFDIGGTDFTIQTWINFNNVSGEQTLIEKFTGGAGPGYTLTKLSDNRIQFFATDFAINSVVATLGTVNWHQIVMRRSGNDLDIFVDGSSIISGTTTATVTPSTNPLLIGRRNGGQQFPVNGLMDEVAFWDRGLSDVEIGQLYNNRNGLDLNAVPEPAALPVLLLIGALVARRRQTRKA